MLNKNTSDLIEPRVYELGTIQTEVWYFRASNGISPGSLVNRTLVKGNEDSWYEAASISVATTRRASLSSWTISDITADFDLIWLPTSN